MGMVLHLLAPILLNPPFLQHRYGLACTVQGLLTPAVTVPDSPMIVTVTVLMQPTCTLSTKCMLWPNCLTVSLGSMTILWYL